jgi:hypothetical protein
MRHIAGVDDIAFFNLRQTAAFRTLGFAANAEALNPYHIRKCASRVKF